MILGFDQGISLAGVIVSVFVAIGTLALAAVAFWSIRSALKVERERREFESRQRLLDNLILMTREIVQFLSNLPPATGDEIHKTANLFVPVGAFLDTLNRVKGKLSSRLESPIEMAGTKFSEYLQALGIEGLEPTTIEQGKIDEAHRKARFCALTLLIELTTCRLEQ